MSGYGSRPRFSYITRVVWGQGHAPGEFWDGMIHAIYRPLVLPELNFDDGWMDGRMDDEAVEESGAMGAVGRLPCEIECLSVQCAEANGD